MTNEQTLAEFMATYAPEGHRQVIELDISEQPFDGSPFVVVKYGRFAVVLNPMPLNDHLCVDAHPFVDGKDATAGVLAMNTGHRITLDDTQTPTTSHKWPSAQLVALLIGEQA